LTESVSQISSTPKVRDTPPHLPEDSTFNKPVLVISKYLNDITNPVIEDKVPENLNFSLYKTEKIPELFALHHINQIMAKA
jgi:hypothetical protein